MIQNYFNLAMSVARNAGLVAVGGIALGWICWKIKNKRAEEIKQVKNKIPVCVPEQQTESLREDDLEIDTPDPVQSESRFDGVVLHVDDERDRQTAKIFCKFVKNNSEYKVGLYDEIGAGKTLLRIPGESLFQQVNFLFVLVTPRLNQDTLTRMIMELGLVHCLEANQFRVIPILTNKHSEKHKPSEIRALKGIQCYWLDSTKEEGDKQRSRDCLLRLLETGRNDFIRSSSELSED
jgi:hypothetical protein